MNGLHLEEAVPLGYALVSRVAVDAGVRLLAIKGPILSLQGLRPEKSSVDIDVLVEPRGYDRMRRALEANDWHEGEAYPFATVLPMHSVTHRHPMWPCEVDLHHWFPGFLADPEVVFDAFWQRRTAAEIAHCQIAVPDHLSHAALAALHYLRDPDTYWGRHRLEELAACVTSSWGPAEVDDLAAFAADTSSAETLRPFLERLGASGVTSTRPAVVPLSDWELRMHAERHEVVRWLVGLGRTPWPRRPRFVWDAVWRGNHQLRYTDTSLPGARRALARARWQRLRRGLRALPAASLGLWRLTRERNRG